MTSRLVLFSGGLDSTFSLWKILKDTTEPVDVLNVGFLHTKRCVRERQSAEEVMVWMAQNMRPIRRCYLSEFRIAEGVSYIGDLNILSMFAADIVRRLFTDELVIIDVGACVEDNEADDEIHRDLPSQHFRRLVRTFLAQFEQCHVEVECLVQFRTVEKLMLMPKELSDLTWSCRNPTREGAACGVCPACTKFETSKERYDVEMGNIVDRFGSGSDDCSMGEFVDPRAPTTAGGHRETDGQLRQIYEEDCASAVS